MPTSGNVRFSFDTVTDQPGVVLTASSQATPVTRLQDIRPAKVWQATGNSAEWVQVAAPSGSSLIVDSVGLVAHNATVGGTVRIQIGDYDETHEAWPPVYGLGDNFGLTLGGYPDLTDFAQFDYVRDIQLGRQVVGPWLRVTIADPGNTAPVRLGRLIAGVPYQPSRNMGVGWSITRVDPSEVSPTDGGGVVGIRRVKYRRLTLAIRMLRLQEALTRADDMARIVGRTRPVLVSLFPEASLARLYRTTIYGLLETDMALANNYPQWGDVAELTFRELR